MNREWEEAHKVTEELVEGPPSRRANATFTASPDGVGGLLFRCSPGLNQETTVRITCGRLEASFSVTTARR
jgi:hypothetical protein